MVLKPTFNVEGVPMLFIIDEKLIAAAQYLVRQIELLTPITRKQILNGLLLVFFAGVADFLFIYAYCVFTIVSAQMLQAFPIFILVVFLTAISVLFAVEGWSLYLENKNEKANNLLPLAILARKAARLVLLAIAPMFAVFFGWVAEVVLNPKYMVPDYAVFLSLFSLTPAFLAVVLEYLLCTTPLPPAEKERRKIEREMKNATPGLA